MIFCDFADPVLHFFVGVLQSQGGSAIGGIAFFLRGAAISQKYYRVTFRNVESRLTQNLPPSHV